MDAGQVYKIQSGIAEGKRIFTLFQSLFTPKLISWTPLEFELGTLNSHYEPLSIAPPHINIGNFKMEKYRAGWCKDRLRKVYPIEL